VGVVKTGESSAGWQARWYVCKGGMEMVAESVATTRTAAARPTRNGRRARVSIDKRFVIGRRIKQLTATFRERVGPDADQDPVLLAAVEKAARLTALAEDAAARATRGTATLDDVVRLTRLADISVRRLRLDRHNTKRASLSDYLAARGGQP
jgi:transposase